MPGCAKVSGRRFLMLRRAGQKGREAVEQARRRDRLGQTGFDAGAAQGRQLRLAAVTRQRNPLGAFQEREPFARIDIAHQLVEIRRTEIHDCEPVGLLRSSGLLEPEQGAVATARGVASTTP